MCEMCRIQCKMMSSDFKYKLYIWVKSENEMYIELPKDSQSVIWVFVERMRT